MAEGRLGGGRRRRGKGDLYQTEEEEFAEIEAAREANDTMLMAIPTDLEPEVRAPLARKQRA